MKAVDKLIEYALEAGLIEPEDRTWAVNSLLEALQTTALPPADVTADASLSQILDALTDEACSRGVLPADSPVYRDLFDTGLMGRLTPRPSQVIGRFRALYAQSPQDATDWFYRFSQDTNYIRRDRIAKDLKWQVATEYGDLDLTINLSKPEKDPRAIAAARLLPPTDYPRCLLCAENEGYPGRADHPARQNHRVIPITLRGDPWFLQYSPYVYYNEHCICLNQEHRPMRIDRACFDRLLDFVAQFPHYFMGSNADLPIVGGSILAHDHFQGGRYTFAMERAGIEKAVSFPGYEDITAGIVKWPMSVIRITGSEPGRLAELADNILSVWREYSDRANLIFSETDGEPHNTITPIARRRGRLFELDLVLRNNITTPEHPFGLYHPHSELHHIKKENIGLIEVMGLAVLPARLKTELAAVAEGLVAGSDLTADELTAKHAQWANSLCDRYSFTADNVRPILQRETGLVFVRVLEHAGVFARDGRGRNAFLRFISTVR